MMRFRTCWVFLLALTSLVCGAQAKTCGSTKCEDKNGFFWDVSCCKDSIGTCCYNRRWWPLITVICVIVAALIIFICICYCCPCCSCLVDCFKSMCHCCSDCCGDKGHADEHRPLHK
uniref:C2H2-type domain-containing protein n=1 Tax=Mesocestoides corti TaxID=53468 RepID=A0A5K3EI38_MESCO